MCPDAHALVRRSWAAARADAALFERQLARALAARLPTLPLLLADGDVAAAAARLAHAADVAVADLDRLHALGRAALGGALPDADTVDDAPGLALLDALALCLGAAWFTPEARRAWATTWVAVRAVVRARGQGAARDGRAAA